MLRLDKVIKPWKESAALNDHINLYGFWNETAFLTKSGDLGMVLSVPGADYESLDRSQQDYAVKRLEAALKAFGPGFHVYQDYPQIRVILMSAQDPLTMSVLAKAVGVSYVIPKSHLVERLLPMLSSLRVEFEKQGRHSHTATKD